MNTTPHTTSAAVQLANNLRGIDARSSWANDKLTKAADELERLDALAASAPVAPAPQPAKDHQDAEDAALLDFIEQHPEMSLRHRKGKWAFVGFTNYEYEMLPSLREAIDAARAQQKGGEPA